LHRENGRDTRAAFDDSGQAVAVGSRTPTMSRRSRSGR